MSESTIKLKFRRNLEDRKSLKTKDYYISVLNFMNNSVINPLTTSFLEQYKIFNHLYREKYFYYPVRANGKIFIYKLV